jgi:hypothetical protein
LLSHTDSCVPNEQLTKVSFHNCRFSQLSEETEMY